MTMSSHTLLVAFGLSALALAACGGAPDEATTEAATSEPTTETAAALEDCDEATENGRKLFHKETFGGNGRACATCHTGQTGTISPKQIEALYKKDPSNPIFRSIDSDDGVGSSYSRLREHATVRVHIPLPSNIKLVGNPSATEVVLNRGIPSTNNTPALDTVLMYDGRAPDLLAQALGAVHDHTQNTREPTTTELQAIADFQRAKLFSSPKLAQYARGGAAPTLPEGKTASEKRGRLMFIDAPFNPPSTEGICATCHSGPMLNAANEHNFFGAPPGSRFFGVSVNDRNVMNNPVYEFEVHEANGDVVIVKSPDPGAMLTRPRPSEFPPFFPDYFLADTFKTPTLWGVKDTAPYFHDNSAKTLEEMMVQYAFFFAKHGVTLTPQDQADAIAYLKLL